KQQGVGRLQRDPSYGFTPELFAVEGFKLLAGDRAEFSTGGDCAALSARRVPEPLHMPPHQRHGSVEADDGELSCYLDHRLDDHLSGFRIKVVELSRVVPRQACAVVAVVD